MNKLQQNAGTAGVVSAVMLALLFVVFFNSGLDFQSINDPDKALPTFALSQGRWIVTGVTGVLGSAFAILFTAGLYLKLRDGAPTRATTVLLLAVLGSTGYALNSLLIWLGGLHLAARAAVDQIAATHAYVAVTAVSLGLTGLGNAFVGAALVIAGWAISTTKALSTGLAWLGIVAGIITVLLLFAPTSIVLNLASFILIIVWLAWAGIELRR